MVEATGSHLQIIKDKSTSPLAVKEKHPEFVVSTRILKTETKMRQRSHSLITSDVLEYSLTPCEDVSW